MTSSLDDIKNQEEDIFEDLGAYDFHNKPQFLHEQSRDKARKQLAVSEDSPFNLTSEIVDENELRRLRAERTTLLRNETEEIKNQLELVKNRLGELKKGRKEPELDKKLESSIEARLNKIKLFPETSKSKLTTKSAKSTVEFSSKYKQPKLRPLTGKVDCPNCECDRRRSVCDMCIKFKSSSSRSKQSEDGQINCRPRPTIEDDRPIRPASQTRTLGVVEAVDDIVVPGRVYTISRSLNDKRTKLAQAIDDLHNMIDQVKMQGNQLDRDRKVAQLYKEQWKFGPSIGGPKASSREHLGPKNQPHKRSYESRLDANLSRDTKSLMGYRSIEPTERSRQYKERKNRIPLRKQPSKTQSRSKSLESLASKTLKTSTSSKASPEVKKVQSSKSSSDTDLNIKSMADQKENPESTVDNQTDDECEVIDASSPPASVISGPTEKQPNLNEDSKENQISDDSRGEGDQSVQRMTWIPVFGETEIKTVNKKPTRRKILVIEPSISPTLGSKTRDSINDVDGFNLHNNNPHRAQNKSYSTPMSARPVNRAPSSFNESIINGATRRLKFASDILEQEYRDSKSKNQLVINRRPVLRSGQRTFTANKSLKQANEKATPSKLITPTQMTNESHENQVQSDTSKEIARLEAMITEQQKLLANLTNQTPNERQLTISPVNVQCSGSCHCHDQQVASSPSKRMLFNGLRDRLNKTKIKLARTLEQERAKHQQLRLKVDSSLKKQSDLEYENELLKQSLSKCIDTCLRDISTTFESISDSLNETVLGEETRGTPNEGTHEVDSAIRQVDGKVLCNAAQFLANNRHLRQMKQRVESIENQRKAIFDELGREKQRTSQLELQLEQSKAELGQMVETKLKLETQLSQMATKNTNSSHSEQVATSPYPSATKHQATSDDNHLDPDNPTSTNTDKSELDDDNTHNSVEAYRRYIESISPDIESIRNERKMILSEFDNIRKMLTNLRSDTADKECIS